MKETKIISTHTETNPMLYKNFFRMYYSEKYKKVNVITLIIAIIMFVVGAYIYYNNMPLLWTGICVWLGLLLIVYPRNAYRSHYRKMKNTRSSTYFDFYEDSMTERMSGNTENYRYSEIYKTIETNQYFYIFHTPESASVVDKNNMKSEDTDELRALLKNKTSYKRKK
ncbi:MAG: YcxB family protein [Clostridia bacterium]